MSFKTWFLQYLLKALVSNNQYFLLSIIIRLTSSKISGNRSCKKILYFIPKTAFIDDLNVIFKDENKDIEVRSFNRQVFLYICDEYFKKGRNEYNFINIDLKLEEKKIYNNLFLFIKNFKTLFQIDGFITCAYNYCEQRDLAKVSLTLGIKFIALHKECITTDITRIVRSDIYKNKIGEFYGSLLLTYNEDEIKTIPFNSINKKVVGSPRTDIYFKKNETNQNIDLLFLTFSKFTYLPHYRGKLIWPKEFKSQNIKPFDFENMFKESIAWIIKFSKENVNKRIVIKSKVGFSIRRFIKIEDLEYFNNAKNIELVETGTAKNLLIRSKVVFGFNTTSLIEAIALNKVVITPVDRNINTNLFNISSLRLSNCNIKVRDYNSFKENIIKYQEGYNRTKLVSKTYQKERDIVLKKYIGYSDGMSGKRTFKMIKKELCKED